MDTKIIKSDDTEINEIVISNKLPFGKQNFKYFIGYKDNKKFRPLCILLPKYKRYFDKTKYTYFMIEKEKVFDEYMEILEKVSNIVKIKFNSELIYNKK